MIEKIDHIEEVREQQTAPLNCVEGYEELTEALVRPAVALECAMVDFATAFLIENSVGAMLEQWGRFVYLPRTTTDDDLYRSDIRGELLAASSSGLIDQLHTIIRLIIGDADAEVMISADESAPACALVVLTSPNGISVEITQRVTRLVTRAKAAGVKINVAFNLAPVGSALGFGSLVSPGAGNQSFSSLVTPGEPTDGYFTSLVF